MTIGWQGRGETHYAAKLKRADVLAIRHAARSGEGLCSIARRYPHVSKVAVLYVIKRRTWRSITEEN